MEVRLLGDVALVDGDRVTPLRGELQRRLLAALALRPGATVSTDHLAEVLWGDRPPAKPQNALQAQASALRKLLPADTLVARGGGYALLLDRSCIDAERLDDAGTEARRLLAEGLAAEAARVASVALDAAGGPALAELGVEDWARADAARLDELRLAVLETRIDADLVCGNHAALVPELERLTTDHPLRERFWAQRITALYRSGRQADALRAHAQVRATLVEELGVEPGPELRRLEAMVLAQDDALEPPPVPQHRRGNLRARLTSFVGREVEVERLASTIRSHRLVTLVGPGGAGKTRLAIETAATVAAPDGVWLVELATVTDPAGVVAAIGAALGLAESSTPGRSDAAVDPLERVTSALAGRAPIILLDNCEHLVDEAARVCDHLLAAIDGLRVVATSREALGVRGEVLEPVHPLPHDAAITLFADRARAVSPSFSINAENAPVVDEICRRLDGLPLAIELAAARLRALGVQQVAARLDDRFRLLTGGSRTALPRQQTLRAVVDWSHDLLFEDERRLFARLSVFVGGCRLDAAETVCAGDGLDAGDVVDLLARLVDKSLVTMTTDADGEARYGQLQTLWEYARERLADTGEADTVRARHAAFHLELARQAEMLLRGATAPQWRRRLSADLDDLRAALDWFAATGDADSACELVTGIAWLWFLRAEWHEAMRWLADALAVGDDTRLTVPRARARAWRAYYGSIVDGRPDHRVDGAEALAFLRDAGTPWQAASAALLHASSLTRLGDPADTFDLLARTAAELEQQRDEWGVAMCDLLLANAHARLGNPAEGVAAARRSVDRFERVGEPWALIEPLGILSLLSDDEPAAALAARDRIVHLCRTADVPGYLVYWLTWRGSLHLRGGRTDAARDDFREAVALDPHAAMAATALVGLARAEARLGNTPAGAPLLARARQLAAAARRPDGEVLVAVASGLDALDRGDTATARSFLADAEALDAAHAALLEAALALAAGDADRATELTRGWAARNLHDLPTAPHGVLAADALRILQSSG